MSLKIDNTINPWISNYDMGRDKKELNLLLDLGYRVSKFISFRDNTTDEVRNYLDMQKELFNRSVLLIDNKIDNLVDTQKNNLENIDHRIQIMEHNSMSTIEENREEMKNEREKYIDMVENITGKIKTSAIKGSIAENFLEETIKKLYPEYTLEVTAKTGHEADMQLYSDTIPKILIESKNYSNPVPTKEITKFKTDLTRVNSNYGVFFSFNSKIIGRDNMEIEKYDDKVILYVSGIDFNTEIISLSITTILYLSKQKEYQKYISADLLSKKTGEILSILNSINELYTVVSKTKYSLLEEKKKISTSLDNIHNAYIENEVLIKNILEKIHNQISVKIAEINCISPDGIYNSIEELLDDNNQDFTRNILTNILMLNKYNIVKVSPGNYNINKKDSEDIISDIAFSKTKCKLNISSLKCQFSISKTELHLIDNYVSILEKL